MKRILLVLILLSAVSVTLVSAQSKLIDKATKITFYSHTPMEDINATTNSALSILDKDSGELTFAVLIKSFSFKRSLMQEHFNEDYMESGTYPKSTFKGTIKNISAVNFNADGNYPVTVTGNLTIHGVTKEVTVTGNLIINGGKISAASEFAVVPQDYNIIIPGVVKEKIAKQIKIQVKTEFTPFQG